MISPGEKLHNSPVRVCIKKMYAVLNCKSGEDYLQMRYNLSNVAAKVRIEWHIPHNR